jgi:hypothetical protein
MCFLEWLSTPFLHYQGLGFHPDHVQEFFADQSGSIRLASSRMVAWSQVANELLVPQRPVLQQAAGKSR